MTKVVNRKKILNIMLVITTLSFTSLFFVAPASAATATFTVNVTTDAPDANPGDNTCETNTSGECSLRAAIEEANANNNSSDVDTIAFSIPGSGVKTFTPQSSLPNITQPISIDGSTQGAVNCEDHILLIDIDGSNAGTTGGLNFAAGSQGSSLNAISLHDFDGEGIHGDADDQTVTCNKSSENDTYGIGFSDTDNTVVQNNQTTNNGGMGIQIVNSANVQILDNISTDNTGRGIQTDSTPDILVEGNYADGNGDSGIRISQSPDAIIRANRATNQDSNGFLIEDGNDRALIEDNVSGNNGAIGLNVTNSSNVTVRHNFLGVDSDGVTPLPNDAAGLVYSSSTGNPSNDSVIGGTTTADRNIIANSGQGELVLVSAGGEMTGNTVQGNYIGVNGNGALDGNFTNIGYGVIILGNVENNLIGGTADAEANIIGGNQAGVGVVSLATFVPRNNAIVGNSIFSNHDDTGDTPGIDLLGDADANFVFDTNVGVTANDTGDSDAGSNDYLNYPIISGITTDEDDVAIKYGLDDPDPSGTVTGYRIEFYANVTANPSGHGDGQIYLGSEDVTGPVTDHTFTIPSTGLPEGTYSFALTATAIDTSTASGLGNTSEFSAIEVAGIVLTNPNAATTTTTAPAGTVASEDEEKTSASGSLASTGAQTTLTVEYIVLLITIGFALAYTARRRKVSSKL